LFCQIFSPAIVLTTAQNHTFFIPLSSWASLK
jgi:hypothetical protein